MVNNKRMNRDLCLLIKDIVLDIVENGYSDETEILVYDIIDLFDEIKEDVSPIDLIYYLSFVFCIENHCGDNKKLCDSIINAKMFSVSYVIDSHFKENNEPVFSNLFEDIFK